MVFTQQPGSIAVQQISKKLLTQLRSSNKTLWLTSGGSAVSLQVEIMQQLAQSNVDLSLLTVLPVDERYGDPGHKDSNSAQMRGAGFDPKNAVWHDVLTDNLSFEETTRAYSKLAEELVARADVVVATLGLGPDGHTAGILPGSPAVTDTASPVVSYEWSDYKRMTLGLSVLAKITEAFVLAYGETKQEALQRLKKNQEPLSELSAKLLYDIPEVTVYNDYITSEG